MAAEFDGGVIIGADSRTTTGAYIANRVTDKLTKVTDNIVQGVCGTVTLLSFKYLIIEKSYTSQKSFHAKFIKQRSAADTQAVVDVVSYHLNFHSMELGKQPLVETAAAVFRELCYNHKDSLEAGILVAGWDRKKGGQVYSIPSGGMCVRQAVSIDGSGSSYVYGYVDANYKTGMSQEECVKFVTNTLALAMARDGSSGGVVRIGIITSKGVERRVVLGTELPKFYEG